MAEILDKTVIGRNAPKQTNVTWIDTSDGTPVLRNNINGKWKPVGGGAGSSRGGSSNPTESDVNKVWQVTPVQKGTNTKETVIVPEQTCVMVEAGKFTICTLKDVDESFGPGFSGVVILDGIEYDVEWFENSDYFVISESFNIGHINSDNVELSDDNHGSTHTIKVITRETEPIYDYNWVPGVKIPVPTAEDEGKILVVTRTEGSNTSIIVPEQSVPLNNEVPLIDTDLTKFVVGNMVKVTITYLESNESNGGGQTNVPVLTPAIYEQTITLTGVIEEDNETFVSFGDDGFDVWQVDNSLHTDAISTFGSSTIKLEYVELNYEYQLQKNSSTSNVIWPARHDYDGDNILATFVPEDVEPNTWCMVCGSVDSLEICLPVFIAEFDSYILFNATSADCLMVSHNIENGLLLELVHIKHINPEDPADPDPESLL